MTLGQACTRDTVCKGQSQVFCLHACAQYKFGSQCQNTATGKKLELEYGRLNFVRKKPNQNYVHC